MVEINDESRGAYNVNSQIKFKTTMLKPSLCDYSDAYILVKGKITIAGAQNANLNHLVEPSFQGVNRLFVLAFEGDNNRTAHDSYYLPTVEIKDYIIMINGENFFDQPIKNNKVTYDNIRKIATGQGDDYTTGCLLDYPYFAELIK